MKFSWLCFNISWALFIHETFLVCKLETWRVVLCLPFFICNRPCSLCILPHENKIALSPCYHKKIFLTENGYKTPFGCLALIFCQKYLMGFLSKIIKETLHTPNKTFLQLQETKRNTLCNFSLPRDKINLWVTMQNATESHKKFS